MDFAVIDSDRSKKNILPWVNNELAKASAAASYDLYSWNKKNAQMMLKLSISGSKATWFHR